MPAGDYQGTYAAEKVIVTVGGVIVTGFADGDFINVKYSEDRYISKAGADGEVGRSKTASRLGEIEITVSGTSLANDELSAIFNLAQIGGIDPPIPFGVADLSGRSFAGASKAWIKSTPDLTFGKEISDRKWVLEAADLTISFGGNG
jgi:hypothetical protein